MVKKKITEEEEDIPLFVQTRGMAKRIEITRKLDEFLQSDREVCTFDSKLSNQDRAVVHQLCLKMGLISKSHGSGAKRKVSVYKTEKKRGTVKESLMSLTFPAESKGVLADLFRYYPPGEEGFKQKPSESTRSTHRAERRGDDSFMKPLMDKAEISKTMELFDSKILEDRKLTEITEKRSKLPIASFRDHITSTLEDHQVVLISGETGCGKTTQVPQFILDHMWRKGEVCKIICTQPRRISAITVAERVSSERGEDIGRSVGYKIRLESKGGRHSSVMFCTNGILLRVLVSRGGQASGHNARSEISDITHIVVDEIHERDCFSDLMLAIIRDLLPTFPHLRLILMSATLDAERFSQYFGGCPIIRVPGFTYPVKPFYLEDVLSVVKSTENNHLDTASSSSPCEEAELMEVYQEELDEAISLAWSSDEFDPLLELISSGSPHALNYQQSSTGATALMVFAEKGRIGDICMLLSLGVDCKLQAHDGSTALDWAKRGNQPEAFEVIEKHMNNTSSNSEDELLQKYLSSTNPELVDIVLIEKLLRKICTDSEDGAILVFLPGWDEINRTRERLRSNVFFKDESKFLIVPLHSMVSSIDQKSVFKRPPRGCRKIILSTNIAETSVTIDDVVYVVDSGRMKEKNYDPYNGVSTLQSSWISKASAKQREGRAGRCQPGVCYHLYSTVRAASLPEFQVPEIRRMPIEELCLQVKLMDPSRKIADFLTKILDPPLSKSIENAVLVLQDIGALSSDEELTELGEKLGSLPVHPVTCKMLLLGILLKCLGPALTLACASDYRDPFTLPMLPHEKKQAAAAKAELASLYGGHGDQLAIIAAFDSWRRSMDMGEEYRFCSKYFVSKGTMRMLLRMRRQLENELVSKGFITGDIATYNLNERNLGVLHAMLVAGLYPSVGKLCCPSRNKKWTKIETASGYKVPLHPRSTNFNLPFMNLHDCLLVVFDEITRGDRGMHIKNCNIVGPLPLLLLAKEIVVAPSRGGIDNQDNKENDAEVSNEDDAENKSKGRGDKIMSSPDNNVTVVVDRWLSFVSTALDVAQIYCLRERLSDAILFKVAHPRNNLPPALLASVDVMACILTYGLSGISLPESVNTLTSMINATSIGRYSEGEILPKPNSKSKAKKSKRKAKKSKPVAQGHDSGHGNSIGTELPKPNSKSKAKKSKSKAKKSTPVSQGPDSGHGNNIETDFPKPNSESMPTTLEPKSPRVGSSTGPLQTAFTNRAGKGQQGSGRGNRQNFQSRYRGGGGNRSYQVGSSSTPQSSQHPKSSATPMQIDPPQQEKPVVSLAGYGTGLGPFGARKLAGKRARVIM